MSSGAETLELIEILHIMAFCPKPHLLKCWSLNCAALHSCDSILLSFSHLVNLALV